MSPFNNELAKYFLVPSQYYTLFTVLVLVLLFVVLLLKGLALWRSARKGQSVWFWVFIFVNTVGILEIIYLLTNKDEFVKIEKKQKKFSFKIKRKSKAQKEDQPNLIEPEIIALNDLENQ
jgi:uncharacterized membrane protein YfhO